MIVSLNKPFEAKSSTFITEESIFTFTLQTHCRAKGDDLIRREMYVNNCKPTMIECRKTDQTINANNALNGVRSSLAQANERVQNIAQAMFGSAQSGFALAA